MAQEATFNLTLRASSPLWRWVNVNDNPSTRWKVHCPKQTASPWCDEQLAFFTGEQGAVAMLEFTGSAITVYGHTSRGMAWAVALDGVPGHSQQMAPHSQVLALFSGLSPDCPHYLSIWTTAAPPKSYMRLDRAEITVGTGTPGHNTTSTYMDSSDTSLSWKDFSVYPNPTQSHVINSATYLASDVLGASVSATFTNASAFIVYGPCFWGCGKYNVTFDNDPVVQYDGMLPASPGVISEQCVRYYRTNINPVLQHTLTIIVAESHRWTTLNLIEFVHVPQEPTAPVASISSTFTPSTFTSVSSTSTTSTLRAAPPSASSQQYGGSSNRRGAIAGGIVGGVVAIGIAVFLIACSRRLVFRGLFHKFRHVSRFSCGGRSNGLDTPGETRTDRLGNEAAPVASSGALFPSDCRTDTQQGDILNAGHSAPPSMTPRMHTTEDSTHPIASYWSRRTVQRSPGNAPPSAFHTEGCRATRLSGTIRNSHTVTQNEADTANSEFTTSLQPQNPEMLLFAPTPRSDFHRAHVGSTSPTQGIPLMSNSTPPSSFLQNFNVSSSALHDRLSTSSTQQSSGEIGRVSSPSLTQISMAVNEILVELAKLRITPGEPVDEGADPAFHDEEAPPLYGTHDSALYTHEMLRSSSNGSH